VKKFNRVLVIGATSMIAEYVSRELAQQGSSEFVFIARNKEKLKKMSSDFAIRFPSTSVKQLILSDTSAIAIEKLVDKAYSGVKFDLVINAIGDLGNEYELRENREKIPGFIETNVILHVSFVEAVIARAENFGTCTIAIFGSVAGDRGRSQNNFYGASKAYLDSYVQGLQQRLVKTPLEVLIIKPGPVATPMTAHLGNMRALANPSKVAKEITAGIHNGKSVIYTPKIWRIIMFIVKLIPAKIFNQLKF
jgi:hypothetical protein